MNLKKIFNILNEADLMLEKGPPERVQVPVSHPMGLSLNPYDMKVIEAFFKGIPDVVGLNITTKQNDDADYNITELRIDLLHGRGRLGLVQLKDNVITLGELGTMVDKTPEGEQVQSIVRNMARERGMQII